MGGTRRGHFKIDRASTTFSSRLLALALVALLLFLTGCAGTARVGQANVTPTLSSKDLTAIALKYSLEQTALQKQYDSYYWMWNVSLPTDRLVVYYGNPFSAAMGPIGAYGDSDLLARLHEQAQAYADLDPTHPVIPALDYVTPVAQGAPMADGTWRARMPDDSIEHYRNLANTNHMLFFMDMQVARSSVQSEVNAVWPFLEQPGVDLALDPEFDLTRGGIPDVNLGHMTAAEINWVIDKLSNLVQTRNLPPKILIIHQFRIEMLPDWQNIRLKPGVEIVTCVDGFGTPGEKVDDYRIFDQKQLIEYAGFKLFYTLDKPLMSPTDVLGLNPAPLMVMYQ